MISYTFNTYISVKNLKDVLNKTVMINLLLNNKYKLKRMKRKHFIKKRGLLTLIISVLTFSLFAQNITVTGNVTDDTGMTVIGATVIVEGDASRGTVTDIDGDYELGNVASDANLVFSYVGFKTQVVQFLLMEDLQLM